MTLREQARAFLNAPTDAKVPAFPAAAAARIVSERFGIVGDATETLSERDQVFLIDSFSGQKFVLRISNPRERVEVIESQNTVLLELQRRCPEIHAPRIQSSVVGRLVEFVEMNGQSHSARMLSYVDGLPIANRALSQELLRDIGRSLALVDRALSQVELKVKGLNNDAIFNLERMGRLRPLMTFIAREEERELVEGILTHLEVEVLGSLRRLRHQVIHNDLNGANILASVSAPNRVAGIIDFGDIVDGALIIDLAVAIARQVGPEEPISSAIEMVTAYNAVFPLSEHEVAILFDLICARLTMRVLLWSWRKSERHPRYHSGRIGNSMAMLALWIKLGRGLVTDRFVGAIQ